MLSQLFFSLSKLGSENEEGGKALPDTHMVFRLLCVLTVSQDLKKPRFHQFSESDYMEVNTTGSPWNNLNAGYVNENFFLAQEEVMRFPFDQKLL